MKKFIYGIIAAILLSLCATTMTSCHSRQGSSGPDTYFSKQEQKELFKLFDQYQNPDFDKTEDFLDFGQEAIDYDDFVSIISALHINTVAAISDNVIRQQGKVNIRSFLNEYLSNRQLYNNIDDTNRAMQNRTNIQTFKQLAPPDGRITKLDTIGEGRVE